MNEIIVYEHKPWILYWVTGLHYMWAASLHFNVLTRNLVVLAGLDYFNQLRLSTNQTIILLCVVGTMALYALLFESKLGRFKCFLLLLPQYTIFFISLLSDTNILLRGYLHCYTPSPNCVDGISHIDRWLLIALLGPLMWGALLHTASILERYIFNTGRPNRGISKIVNAHTISSN